MKLSVPGARQDLSKLDAIPAEVNPVLC
jgi:hypothetical protein